MSSKSASHQRTRDVAAVPFTPLDAVRARDIDPEALKDFFGVTPETLRRLEQPAVLKVAGNEFYVLAPSRFAERCARIVSHIVCDVGIQPPRTVTTKGQRHREYRAAREDYASIAGSRIAERWRRHCVTAEGVYQVLLAMVTTHVDRVYGNDVAAYFLEGL